MGTYTRLFAAVAFSAGLAGTPAAFEMNSDAGAAPQETTAEWVKRGLPASYYVTRDFTVADLCIKDALDQRAADAARAGLTEIYLDAAGFGQLQAKCRAALGGGFPVYFVYADVIEVQRGDMPSLPLP